MRPLATTVRPFAVTLALASLAALAVLAAPRAAHAAPDEVAMGRDQGYPVCRDYGRRKECRVGFFSNPQGRRVEPSSQPRPLVRRATAPAIAMDWAGERVTLPQYLASQKATALMVLHAGEIVFEGYQYGRHERSLLRSFSMAKTITAMLVGLAHARGDIVSLDDPAERYVPAITGNLYGRTSIRHLLRMSSGVKFDEQYHAGADSDLGRFFGRVFSPSPNGFADAVRLFNQQATPAGARFNYATSETEVLARVLTGATGRTMTDLTQAWLWEPMGAEDPGYWLVATSDRVENGGSGFFASLRDWAKLGVLLANDGRVGDRQVLPLDFLLEATDPARVPPAFRPGTATRYSGYGYQTWLFPMRERTFALQGIHGQSIFVQPASGVVMVQLSVYDQASGDPMVRHKDAMWRAVLRALGGSDAR